MGSWWFGKIDELLYLHENAVDKMFFRVQHTQLTRDTRLRCQRISPIIFYLKCITIILTIIKVAFGMSITLKLSNYRLDIVDSSGMRFFVTDQLRPTEIGSITIAMGVNPMSLTIPPGQSKFKLFTFCSPRCTKV